MSAGPEQAVRKVVTQHVFLHVVEAGLRLLHPMMPYVTEELWHRMPHYKSFGSESIMVAQYPQPAGWRDTEVENKMKIVQDVIHQLRSVKASYNLTNKVKPDCWIVTTNPDTEALLTKESPLVEALAWVGKCTVIAKSKESEVPVGCGFSSVSHEVGAHMLLKGIIDVTQELKKLEKALGLVQKSLDGLQAKMGVPNYKDKVPEAVQKANSEKEAQLLAEVAQQKEAIARMQSMA